MLTFSAQNGGCRTCHHPVFGRIDGAWYRDVSKISFTDLLRDGCLPIPFFIMTFVHSQPPPLQVLYFYAP